MTTLEKIKLEITSHFVWDGEVETELPYAVQKCLEIIDKYAEQSGWEEMTVPCENCGKDMTFKIAVCGEPKTGHWEKTDDKYGAFFICGNCHRQSDIMENFCPNCGARMAEPTCDTCKYNTATFMPCNACDNKSLFEPKERSDKE